MKTLILFLMIGLTAAQAVDIHTWSGGTITWTNATTGTTYRVEWAASLDGPWYSSWQGPSGLESGSNTTLAVQVPSFYRLSEVSPTPSGMSFIEASPFSMGNHNDEWAYGETPVHDVYVDAFYIDRYEFSNERMRQVLQWARDQGRLLVTPEAVSNAYGQAKLLVDLGAAACEISYDTNTLTFAVDSGRQSFPCVAVSWYGAMACAAWRSDMEGLTRSVNMTNWTADLSQPGYRLPTEAEWEKAGRGGLQGHYFPWPSYGGSADEHIGGSNANYCSSSDPWEEEQTQTTPVGYYNGNQSPAGPDMANGFGIYDMSGNVAEWCLDWYSDSYYAISPTNNPTGPASGDTVVLRGDSWTCSDACFIGPIRGRIAFRTSDYPYNAVSGGGEARYGFRCVRR